MRLTVRTWNLAHGRTVPCSETNKVREMVELAANGPPDILCLQELPIWAVRKLTAWTGLSAFGSVGRRSPAGVLARPLTALAPGTFRSALTGQALAILTPHAIVAGSRGRVILNPARMRLGMAEGMAELIHWSRDRRVGQLCVLRMRTGDVGVGNIHLTHFRDRLAEAELDRAEQALRRVPGNVPRVLCGDFNLSPDRSPAFARLARSGWSLPTAGIDHVLGLRLVPTGPAQAWPVERRRSGQTVLSDHAPVDAELTVG